MEKKKDNGTSWLLLGAVFILVLFGIGVAGVSEYSDAYAWSTGIFGLGGILFLIIGIFKFIASRFR